MTGLAEAQYQKPTLEQASRVSLGQGLNGGALERLKGGTEPLPDAMAAFGIAGGKSFSRLFMSPPPLDERIAALRAKAG